MPEANQRSKKMDLPTLITVILSIGLLAFAFFRDRRLAWNGIQIAGNTLLNNLLLLLAGFLLAGLVQVLLPKDLISKWLGDESGFRSVLIGCAAGGLIPGAPYAVFPIVGGLYQAGAGLGAVVGFVTAWALWSISRLPVEIALIDPKVAMIRYGITFLFPPLAGFIAQMLSKALI
jgi:uncharacterized membrane protein YraQ (UPF0718 family)